MSRSRTATRCNIQTSFALVIALMLGGCQSVYYGAMEKIGIEKRDILVNRVDNAREAQRDAKDQFESALEKFIAVTDYSGGDLEKQYRALKSEYEDSVSRADAVHDKISSVEDVADALFNEWEDELKQYSSAELRRSSERQLKATKKSYSSLISAMKRAEKKIDPVLAAFNDRVLYLKHNLNANAIASLKTQRRSVETDIQDLISDMTASIAEADKFIKSMSKD